MISKKELHRVICLASKKYNVPPLIIKAVCFRESSYNDRAYRYEPGFFQNYLKNMPEWKDKDPAVVSASYGLMQLMWTTAASMGFNGTVEDLYNPETNVDYGTKLLRMLIDAAFERVDFKKFFWLSALMVALARYNGGSSRNPDSTTGELRNQKYVTNVLSTWEELKKAGEDPCQG